MRQKKQIVSFGQRQRSYPSWLPWLTSYRMKRIAIEKMSSGIRGMEEAEIVFLGVNLMIVEVGMGTMLET